MAIYPDIPIMTKVTMTAARSDGIAYWLYSKSATELGYLLSKLIDISINDKSLRCRWQTRATQFLLLGLAAEYNLHGGCDQHCRRPSDIYDTHRQIKLTVPETINHSRDMAGAHQNLNGSRDLTTPLSAMAYHTWASNCYWQSTYQIWSFYLHLLRRYKRRHKMSKMGWFGVVRVTQGHWK